MEKWCEKVVESRSPSTAVSLGRAARILSVGIRLASGQTQGLHQISGTGFVTSRFRQKTVKRNFPLNAFCGRRNTVNC